MSESGQGKEIGAEQRQFLDYWARFEELLAPLEEEVNRLPYDRRVPARNHLRAVRHFAIIGVEPFGEILAKCFVLAAITTFIALMPGAAIVGLIAYENGLSASVGRWILAFVAPTWAIAVAFGFWVGRSSPPGD